MGRLGGEVPTLKQESVHWYGEPRLVSPPHLPQQGSDQLLETDRQLDPETLLECQRWTKGLKKI